MTDHHDLKKNNKCPASSRDRRRRPEQYTRKAFTSLTALTDMGNVQLEQALRELRCFEGLDRSSGHTNYRTFALEYIEGLLERWSCSVEEAKHKQERSQSPSVASPSSLTKAQTTKPLVKANAWDRPLSSVLGRDSTSPKPSFTPSGPGAALIPFGSYRLGVHSNTSDLDLLTLAPPYIERFDFFSSLVKIFQEDERCQDVHPISSAYTPVIKFVLKCGENEDAALQIDLVFARVVDDTKLIEYHRLKNAAKQQGNVWDKEHRRVDYILDDTDLEGLDEAGVRSLNGARVSQILLETVRYDVGKFQIVLCAVKHWAISRGIYSNVLGFLGGINWAILVAWVCQNYPCLSASATLKEFFLVFGQWRWNNPVLLTAIADTPPITNAKLQTQAVRLKAWNPQTNPRDGMHVMPIITPAYPSMNSSYNVGYPQLRFIQQEMVRTAAMFRSQANVKDNIYRKLFVPTDFFDRHKHFLQINIRATNKQDFVEWFRLVESKIRLLVSTLETTEVNAWPLARFFTPTAVSGMSTGSCDNESCEKVFFIALRFRKDIESMDVRPLTMDFHHKVNTWEGRKSTMDLSMTHILEENLPYFVWEALSQRYAHRTKDNGAERSVNSENTAPATDDEEDDYSCRSGEAKSEAYPPDSKKYRVEMTSGVN